MLQEVNFETAIKLFQSDKNVSVIVYDTTTKKRIMDTLDNLLTDAVFLADTSDIDKLILDESKPHKKTKPKYSKHTFDEIDASEVTATKRDNTKVSNSDKRRIDIGKLYALHRGGRSASFIADEMGISVATVYRYLKNTELMTQVLSPTDLT